MTIYHVFNNNGYSEEFHSLTAAKKAMREHNAKGTKTKFYSNGDWEPCGEITLSGSNKTFMANTRQTKPGY